MSEPTLRARTAMAALAAFERAGIRHCILRNHEEIPADPGRDIDLIVSDRDLDLVEAVLRTVAGDLGWPGLYRCRGHHEGTSYYLLDPAPRKVRQLEFHFTRIRWARLPVLTPEAILDDMTRGTNGLWVASDRQVAVQRLVQMGLAGEIPSMKPSYRDWLVEYGRAAPEALVDALEDAGFDRSTSSEIVGLLGQGDVEALDRRVRRLRAPFVLSRLRQSPGSVVDVVRLAMEKRRLSMKPRCGVVLAGADTGLVESVRPMFLEVMRWDGADRGRFDAMENLAKAGLVLLDGAPETGTPFDDVTVDATDLSGVEARAAVVDRFGVNHIRL